jgi:hypothetical protein
LSFNRSAILVAINGDFKFRPLQGKRVFRPFLQRVVTALGGQWVNLDLEVHELKTRVAEVWAAMNEEHLEKEEVERPDMGTSDDMQELLRRIQEMTEQHTDPPGKGEAVTEAQLSEPAEDRRRAMRTLTDAERFARAVGHGRIDNSNLM